MCEDFIPVTFIKIAAACIKRRFWQDLFPFNAVFVPVINTFTIVKVNRLHRSEWWVITQEEIGIYIDAFDLSTTGQLYNAPLLTNSTLPSRFPSIPPLTTFSAVIYNKNSSSLLYQVFFLCKQIIGSIQYFSAFSFSGKVCCMRK